MPLVSVVVPTHNRPEMLDEALASARMQTVTDCEIIVVSNGENPAMREKSEAIAAIYNCRYFALPKGNVSAARNFGIEQANGEWIAFLDDDDLWLPTKLERQVAEAQRSGADMISCDYVEFYADGRELVRKPRVPDGWNHTKAINHLCWWATPSGVIIRGPVLDTVGGFDRRQRYSEDNDLWRRISWRHHICSIEEVLFRYRQGHASMMQRERLRYLYDIRYFIKMHFDTPSDLRSALANASFFWNRVAIICFPRWLTRELELTPWGGVQWHRLWSWFLPAQLRWIRPRTRWNQFKRMLRPRTRIMQLRGYLKIRTRAKAAVRAIASVVGL
jgi:glycosyltransferase involved in cell wall biosynthesis